MSGAAAWPILLTHYPVLSEIKEIECGPKTQLLKKGGGLVTINRLVNINLAIWLKDPDLQRQSHVPTIPKSHSFSQSS